MAQGHSSLKTRFRHLLQRLRPCACAPLRAIEHDTTAVPPPRRTPKLCDLPPKQLPYGTASTTAGQQHQPATTPTLYATVKHRKDLRQPSPITLQTPKLRNRPPRQLPYGTGPTTAGQNFQPATTANLYGTMKHRTDLRQHSPPPAQTPKLCNRPLRQLSYVTGSTTAGQFHQPATTPTLYDTEKHHRPNTTSRCTARGTTTPTPPPMRTSKLCSFPRKQFPAGKGFARVVQPRTLQY